MIITNTYKKHFRSFDRFYNIVFPFIVCSLASTIYFTMKNSLIAVIFLLWFIIFFNVIIIILKNLIDWEDSVAVNQDS